MAESRSRVRREERQRRTKRFALGIIKLFQSLPRSEESRIIGRQVLRSGTSVAANYRAVCRARSRAEFIAKLGTVVEEADETVFWLDLLAEAGISRQIGWRVFWQRGTSLFPFLSCLAAPRERDPEIEGFSNLRIWGLQGLKVAIEKPKIRKSLLQSGTPEIRHSENPSIPKSMTWVFKINTRRGWQFAQYFRSRARGVYPLGDEDWIRSASSLRYIRENVKRGDLFFCYEVDRKLMVGVARAASNGRDRGEGSLLDFCPPPEAVHLRNPLTRHPDLDHIQAFTPSRGRGTIQRIEPDEAARLKRTMLRKNPGQAAALRRLFGGR